MPKLLRYVLLFTLVLATGAPAAGKDARLTEHQAADLVAVAVAAGDTQALRRLASRDQPDPWRVADVLLSKGQAPEALAFAKSVPRRVIASLPAYIASRTGVQDGPDRKAVDAMTKALLASNWAEMLQATDRVKDKLDVGKLVSVPLVLLAYGRGRAQLRLRDPKASAQTLSTAAQAAVKLGWVRLGAAVYGEASRSARAARDLGGALTAAQSSLDVLRYLDDSRGVAFMLVNDFGRAQAALGQFEAAAETYAEAAGLFAAQGDPLNRATALHKQADAQQRRGRPSEALALFDQALRVSRRAQAGVAYNLVRSASVLHLLGSYKEATARCAEAIPLFRALVKMEGGSGRGVTGYQRGILNALTTMGNARLRLGQYALALKRHQEALTLAKQMKYKVGVATTLNNIANVHGRLGAYADAIASYKEALEISRDLKDDRRVAKALVNLGNVERDNVERDQERLTEARDYYEQAIAIFRTAGKKTASEDAGLAGALMELGTLESRYEKKHAAARKRYVEAGALFAKLEDKRGQAMALNSLGVTYVREDDFAKAELVYSEALGKLEDAPNPAVHVTVLWSMAWLRFNQERYQDAIALVRQAIEMVSDLAQGLAEGEGAGARDVFGDLFDAGVRAAVAAGDVAAQTWMFEHGRADSLRKGLGSREALQAAVVPEPLRLALIAAKARSSRADKAHARAKRRGKTAPLRAALAEKKAAESAVHQVAKQIQREAKAAAQLVFDDPDELATIQTYLGAGEALVSYGLTDGEAVAVVVTEKGGRMVALGPSDDVRTLALALDVSDRTVSKTKWEAARDALRKRIVDRLELGADVKRVLLSPTGVLGYIPFALLFDQEVAYVPSGTTYGLLRAQRSLRGQGVLALGDPDYTTHARRLARLAATAKEIEQIGTKKLLRKDASETALPKALLEQVRWRAVHFACHGLVDAERAWLSSLALTRDGESDGLLTCLEIFQMKIPADLVVLSACETGKGRIFKTEGIVGLTRAFMFAGAPRVICSLWKVDDDATSALMRKFYELWNPKSGKGGLGPAEALREAQKFVREHKDPKGQTHWEHPYYWAAWVLWGLPE